MESVPDERENNKTPSRFVTTTMSVSEFNKSMENSNTARKTRCDLALINQFFESQMELRQWGDIPLKEMSDLLSNFVLQVRI